jgi:hypothetical protein
MALDFVGLREEFFARGFEYLDDNASGLVRAKRWINDAMHMIDEMEDWPYLQASTTGTAPLTISDLRKVESVSDAANFVRLRRRSRGELADTYADLTTTGSPSEYYVTGGTTINVYPANTSTTLTVTYWKFGSDLTNDTDTPLMPDRFRYAIVEYAVATALRDDESQDSLAAQQAGDVIVDRMRQWSGFLEPSASFVPLIGDDS